MVSLRTLMHTHKLFYTVLSSICMYFRFWKQGQASPLTSHRHAPYILIIFFSGWYKDCPLTLPLTLPLALPLTLPSHFPPRPPTHSHAHIRTHVYTYTKYIHTIHTYTHTYTHVHTHIPRQLERVTGWHWLCGVAPTTARRAWSERHPHCCRGHRVLMYI